MDNNLVNINQKKIFCLLYPGIQDSHITKDVGIIPFIMQQRFNYRARIATYKKGEYPSIDKFTKGVEIDFIDDTGNVEEDLSRYILENGQDISVLYLYGAYEFYFKIVALFKTINGSGKVYLKLDANISWMDMLGMNNILENFLKQCDVISVECKKLHLYLNRKWPVKVEYIPNGFYDFNLFQRVNFNEKENTILTVGRIGTRQKANEVLLEAYKKVSNFLTDWKLKFIGEVEKSFIHYINDFFTSNPELQSNIIFSGSINSKEDLNKEYRKAKIFCMTSRWEGFPNVFSEAARNGCFIINTDIDPAWDITDDGKYGELFKIDDVNGLSELLIKVTGNEDRLYKTCFAFQEFAEQNFSWVNICARLNILLNLR